MKTKSILSLTGILLLTLTSYIAAQELNMTDIEVKNIDAINALIIKADVPMQDISAEIGKIYMELYTYAGQSGIQPSGMPIAVYYSYQEGGNVVFEGGIPVSANVKGKDNIKFKSYPAMKAVTTTYTGSYENMAPVYEKIQKYIDDNKLKSTGVTWEVYMTDPQTLEDPDQNKTIIYFPVE